MSYNPGKLDGFPIDLYDGRFSGTFELEDDEGEAIGYDDTVTFLVVASAGQASFKTMKNGDLKRTNVFSIMSSRIVPVDTAVKFVGELNELAGEEAQNEVTLFDVPEWDDSDFYGDDEEEPLALPDEPEFMDVEPKPLVSVAPPTQEHHDDVIVMERKPIVANDAALTAFLNE